MFTKPFSNLIQLHGNICETAVQTFTTRAFLRVLFSISNMNVIKMSRELHFNDTNVTVVVWPESINQPNGVNTWIFKIHVEMYSREEERIWPSDGCFPDWRQHVPETFNSRFLEPLTHTYWALAFSHLLFLSVRRRSSVILIYYSQIGSVCRQN